MDSRSKALLKGAAILLSLFFGFINLSARVYEVKSPSGKLTLSVSAGTTCTWSLSVGEKQIIKDSRLGLDAGSVVLGDNAVVARRLRGSKTENIEAPFYRQARFSTQYNYLILKMRGGWDLEMRAYDDGVAYRFITHFKKPLRILGERLEFQFTNPFETLAPFVIPDKKDRYRSSFENEYSSFKTGDDMGDNLAFTPVYVDIGDAGRLLLMEADLWDYPGMFLKTSGNCFVAEFPPYPAGYLADVDGERTYPWRVVAYAEHETDLPVNNMVYQLAAPCRIDDISWIHPGQSTWDWWAGFTLHGVDFKAGINTESYLYAIDFAAKYGIRYILVDAGWYKGSNIFDTVDGFDPSRICSYARSKGVGVVLWVSQGVLGLHPDKAFEHYSKIGVSGFKIDYFDSQGADMVKRIGTYAESAAKYHLVLDFHGIYKPTGLNRTWPNVLNFEGVFGLEQLKWCNPDKTDMPRHDAIIPFVRMAAGFMDYTPGALRNAGKNDFRAVYTRPMSMGTRAHQLACYVCFDSPFTMLCDSPSDYLSEDETTRWISSIPTVFDSSWVLSGKIGEWIVSLREKDGVYYIGGLGSWDERDVAVDFSFLPEGLWQYRLFSDGPNAEKVPSDYSVEEGTIADTDKMNIHFAPGGGFVMILQKKPSCPAYPAVQSLTGDAWQMKQVRGYSWYPANVPGTVHTDLMAAGVIDDPYFGFNERSVQWVDKEDWLYVRSFDLSDDLASRGRVELCFDGLDTYADVRLNGKTILEADNMFRRWRCDVTDILLPWANTLEIYFHSPIKKGLELMEKSPVTYYASNDQSANGGLFGKQVSMFTRKAGYHYGWDWGPRIVTSGIWRDVRLEAWDTARIVDVFYKQTSVDAKKAELEAVLEIECEADVAGADVVISAEGMNPVSMKTCLSKGINRISVPFTINKPRLWWSRGLGEQHLYSFRSVLSIGGNQIDSRTDATGLRSIHLLRDVPGKEGRFYFELNGVPVFMKGANYIPNDIFLPRVGAEGYERVVASAADAGMNMLRVWGGGVYEDDLFYELCDRAGILVWQDFMFACTMYPYEGELRESILAEAEDNIRRLRNHPCVALWCGNNENSSMWYTWGIQSGNKEADRITIEQYDRQYFTDLPAVVSEFAPGTDYLPTSPMMECGGGEKCWDLHDWDAWSKADPGLFERTQAPFYSEYGFQSFAGTETASQFAPDRSLWAVDSEMMMFHQRGGTTANGRMMKTLEKFYRVPSDYSEAAYLSQICQADAIKLAIEHHRRGKPVTWGSLYWQINDCWPVASWSSRDWYGTWKALHYSVRDAYRDLLLSFSISGNEVSVWMCSDLLSPCRGRLDVSFMTFDGRELYRESQKLNLGANSSAKIKSYDVFSFGEAPERMIVVAVFTEQGGASVKNHRMLSSVKDADLPESRIAYRIKPGDGIYEIELSSDTFAKGVFLNVEGGMLRTDSNGHAIAGNGAARNFSDNYFDILPGETVNVKIESEMPLEEFESKLTIHSL